MRCVVDLERAPGVIAERQCARKEACDPHARSQWQCDVPREPEKHQTWPRDSILEAHLLLKGIQRSHRHVLCDLRDLLLAKLLLLQGAV